MHDESPRALDVLDADLLRLGCDLLSFGGPGCQLYARALCPLISRIRERMSMYIPYLHNQTGGSMTHSLHSHLAEAELLCGHLRFRVLGGEIDGLSPVKRIERSQQ